MVSLAGLSAYAPQDPEPEFVDINDLNEAVVTLQENNHAVIVDLPSLTVKEHFGMGTVTLNGIDLTDDGVISLTETQADVPREPDAVTWVPGRFGKLNIATANEGDLFGGSRGFSIFRRNGTVAFDSGTSLEDLAVQHGHYPEDRSENKGTEPEAIEYGRFWRDDYVFVGTERSSFVAVYKLDHFGRPNFELLLPAPLGPEGLLAIPQRNLLVASGETDDPSFGVRSTLMIYELKRGKPAYPQILSDESEGSAIPWSALSGMVAIPWKHDSLLAVWDEFYSQSNIFRIDVSERPAVITDSLTIQGGSGDYDPEGIAIAPDKTLWIASEGNADDSRPNLLLKTDFNGNVIEEIGLPPEVIACRAASTRRGTLGSGFEGVAVLRAPARHSHYRLVVAQQRGWDYTTRECEDLDDDAGGLNASGEPNWTRIWIYDPKTNAWDHVASELAPKPMNASWVGLSEITKVPGGDYILIERDNRTGDFAVLKTLVKIDRHAVADKLIRNSEKAVCDLLPDLTATNGWITDKPEGVAVTSTGRTYVVTDNDGVDDWSGESWFFDLGRFWRLFP
ncbi:MAG: esterase-like activity of phytase family protein [Chromatiales bacterium]